MPNSPVAEPGRNSAPVIHWTENSANHTAIWRSERAAPPPKQIVVADDAMNADAAYQFVCAGTALLWRGDYHNAIQLLQALDRRIGNTPARKQRNRRQSVQPPLAPAEAFHRHRLTQSQRARLLGALLLPFNPDNSVALRRAPDTRQCCAEVWRAPETAGGAAVAPLRDLLGMIGAHEWRKRGIEIAALGAPPNNRIHPHYGVFSPLRGEYIGLVAAAALPRTGEKNLVAFDIGTGTGVLAALLARRGVARVIGTDRDPRALACAGENLERLGLARQVEVVHAELFPAGQASLILCNPPWLPARPSSPMDANTYDEDSRMLLGFLHGAAAHLAPGGEAWLILSDLAEHLGLRSRAELLAAIAGAGLKVLDRIDTRARHPKAADAADPLHFARAAEITSLWRLGAI